MWVLQTYMISSSSTFWYKLWVFLLPGTCIDWHWHQVSTVLQWVVCRESWVYSCWGYLLWEFPGCWKVVLAKTDYIVHHHCPGRLCSGDSRTMECFPFLLTCVQFMEHTYSCWLKFFVVRDHLRSPNPNLCQPPSHWLWLRLKFNCQVWSMSRIWACALHFKLTTPSPSDMPAWYPLWLDTWQLSLK